MDARALTSQAETAFQTGDVGNGLVLGDRTEPMSALGQKQIGPCPRDVRFTPKSGHRNRHMYHLRRTNSGSFRDIRRDPPPGDCYGQR